MKVDVSSYWGIGIVVGTGVGYCSGRGICDEVYAAVYDEVGEVVKF